MTHTTIIPIAPTSKGHRLWIQGLDQYGWNGGTQYTVTMTSEHVVYTKATTGRTRTVTASKGGIIDTTSKKVTQWAQGATQAMATITTDVITIGRVQS